MGTPGHYNKKKINDQYPPPLKRFVHQIVQINKEIAQLLFLYHKFSQILVKCTEQQYYKPSDKVSNHIFKIFASAKFTRTQTNPTLRFMADKFVIRNIHF